MSGGERGVLETSRKAEYSDTYSTPGREWMCLFVCVSVCVGVKIERHSSQLGQDRDISVCK